MAMGGNQCVLAEHVKSEAKHANQQERRDDVDYRYGFTGDVHNITSLI
jgi:hypothetical protein